ncbi:MAG: hypothetical protein MZV70_54185 [Desulfobacterales bacterium]|nr:hypothetical protein [Desulfobacterales bacterium]
MMNPACKHALEAALRIKAAAWRAHHRHHHGPSHGRGDPPRGDRHGRGLGASCSPTRPMAGADTHVTSYTLARAIEIFCSDFDLILCGCHTTDSETAQVGPQLAEELDIPGIAYVERAGDELGRTITDPAHFRQLPRDPGDGPALSGHREQPALPPAVCASGRTPGGLRRGQHPGGERGRPRASIRLASASKGSPTKILDVYTPRAEKKNIVLNGRSQEDRGGALRALRRPRSAASSERT